MHKVQLPIELDPYREYSDLPIELLTVKEEKWSQIAQEVIGENAEARKSGIDLLKVKR